MANLPRKPWKEPAPEPTAPSFTTRKTPSWSEPQSEELVSFSRAAFTMMQPSSKSKSRPPGYPQGSELPLKSELQSMPRFKRVRFTQPKSAKSGEEEKRRSVNDIWLHTILHLATFSGLYNATTNSDYQKEHLEVTIKNFNSNSLLRHLQIWQHFCDWCKPLGFHPATIPMQTLLDFIYEASYEVNKQSYSMHSLIRSLRFISQQAEVSLLKDILWAPVISGYLSETKKPKNPREVFPLPFHYEIALERYVLNPLWPESNRFLAGCFLFQFWSGLRYQDMQRVQPKTLSLQEGILRCISCLTKSGAPQPAAALACGFTSKSFLHGWGYIWMELMQKWIKVVSTKSTDFELDFIFPDIQQEGALSTSLIPRPLQYSKASTILRFWAKCAWMSPPYNEKELLNITVHSTKSSLISAAKQLDLPPHWLVEQGHHRGQRTQTDRYSRDDTLYSLFLQRTIVDKIRIGWRPLIAQARGGQVPMSQKLFQVPDDHLSWPPFLFPSVHSENLERAVPAQQSDKKDHKSDSSSSSSSDESSEEAPSERPLETVSYILNAFTRVAHVAKYSQDASFPDAACGARLTLEKHQYPVVDSVPADYDFCQHKACAQSQS